MISTVSIFHNWRPPNEARQSTTFTICNFDSEAETEMGHYCRICGRERPNEQFSGKGHKIHVCKRCNAKPKSERQAIEDTDTIFAFMQQSHISERNVARLKTMAKSENSRVASLAAAVLKVAEVKPHKTKRLKFLAKMHPEILRNLEDTGLILAHTREWESPGTLTQNATDSLSSLTEDPFYECGDLF
jgi:hypothetical protein